MRNRTVTCLILGLAVSAWSQTTTVKSVHGDVRVRRDLSETWTPVRFGDLLKAVDTIRSGEAGEAVLTLEGGTSFRLGAMSILDIGDLRRITERELFLYVMAEKVRKLPETEPGKLEITRVSVVRAEDRSVSPDSNPAPSADLEPLEFNGAKALFDQAFVTNAALKTHRLLERYAQSPLRPRGWLLLGACYESLNQPGRALEAYRAAQSESEKFGDSQSGTTASAALQRLESAAE